MSTKFNNHVIFDLGYCFAVVKPFYRSVEYWDSERWNDTKNGSYHTSVLILGNYAENSSDNVKLVKTKFETKSEKWLIQ